MLLAQPWPLHHRANCRTAALFSFYLIGFFHSETNVKQLGTQPGIDPLKPTEKKARGSAGNRAWPNSLEYHNFAHYFIVALAGGAYFSTLPNPFFHSGTNLKELAAQPWIDPGPSGFEHRYTTANFLRYLILFFHSWANLLYGYLKGWGPRLWA